MVLLPVAGKPVRHIAGGLGNEGWPIMEDNVENWSSRHGYAVLSSWRMAFWLTVIGDDVPEHALSCGERLPFTYVNFPIRNFSKALVQTVFTVKKGCKSRSTMTINTYLGNDSVSGLIEKLFTEKAIQIKCIIAALLKALRISSYILHTD